MAQYHLSSANWTRQYIKTIIHYQTEFMLEIRAMQTQSEKVPKEYIN